MTRGDLSDEKWAQLEPLLPPEHSGKKGHPYNDHRKVLGGILWRLRTGSPWRDVPERYGPYQTCYDRFVHFKDKGLWQQILETLQQNADADGQLDWAVGSADGTIVRAHQHAAGAPLNCPHAAPLPPTAAELEPEPETVCPPSPPTRATAPAAQVQAQVQTPRQLVQKREALGYSRGGFGTKVHLVVERQGRPLAVTLSPGQAHESQHVAATLDAVRVPRVGRGRPKKRMNRLLADRAFNGKPARQQFRRRRIRVVTPPRSDDRARRLRAGRKGGRPYNYDRELYKERNVVERCFSRLKQFRAVATRYDKLANSYLAGVTLAMIMLWLA